MAEIIRRTWNGYQIFFNEMPDPITRNWPLCDGLLSISILGGFYLAFVYKWGPEFMKNREPYKLNTVMKVYNLLQVVLCAYLLYRSLVWAWAAHYKWICQPVNYAGDYAAVQERLTVYYYFLLKILDLVDTVIFVLRKKFNQVSFLHVYHHFGMVFLCWGATTLYPGGHGTLIGVINSFVHVVMYFYYFLTVAVPSFKNAIWFKKLITQLQILQFFWCAVHMGILFFVTDCAYPRWVSVLFVPQNVFMLILFIDFYIKAYIKKPRKQIKSELNVNNGTTNGSHNIIQNKEKTL